MADMAEMADFQAIFSGFRGVKFQPLENGADKNLTYNWCFEPQDYRSVTSYKLVSWQVKHGNLRGVEDFFTSRKKWSYNRL